MTTRRQAALNVLICGLLGWGQYSVLAFLWTFIPRNSLSQWAFDALLGTAWLRPYLFIHDLAINVVLCLPLAFCVCALVPRRLVLNTASAMLPVFVWTNVAIIGHPYWSQIWPSVTVAWAGELLMLPLAVLLLRRRVGGEPPNHALQSDTSSAGAAQLGR